MPKIWSNFMRHYTNHYKQCLLKGFATIVLSSSIWHRKHLKYCFRFKESIVSETEFTFKEKQFKAYSNICSPLSNYITKSNLGYYLHGFYIRHTLPKKVTMLIGPSVKTKKEGSLSYLSRTESYCFSIF